MNDDIYSSDLHAWIEPEIEARVVALIVGEASDFEGEELERLMEERPEIRVFRRRLESVHGLLGVALDPGDDEEWKLAPEARAELFKSIELQEPSEKVAVLESADGKTGRERRIRRAGRRVFWSAAACFVLTLFLFVLVRTGGIKEAAPMASEADKRDHRGLMMAERGGEAGAPEAKYQWLGNYEAPLAGNGVRPAREDGMVRMVDAPEVESSVREQLAKLGESLRWDERGGADDTIVVGAAKELAPPTVAFTATDEEEHDAKTAAGAIKNKEEGEVAQSAPRSRTARPAGATEAGPPPTQATAPPQGQALPPLSEAARKQPESAPEPEPAAAPKAAAAPALSAKPAADSAVTGIEKSELGLVPPSPTPAPTTPGYFGGKVDQKPGSGDERRARGATAAGLAEGDKDHWFRDETRARVIEEVENGWELSAPAPAEDPGDASKGKRGLQEGFGLADGFGVGGKSDEALNRRFGKESERLSVRGEFQKSFDGGQAPGQAQAQGSGSGLEGGNQSRADVNPGTPQKPQAVMGFLVLPDAPATGGAEFAGKALERAPAPSEDEAKEAARGRPIDSLVKSRFRNLKKLKQRDGEGQVVRNLSLDVSPDNATTLSRLADKDGDGQPQLFGRASDEERQGKIGGGGGGFAYRAKDAKEAPPAKAAHPESEERIDEETVLGSGLADVRKTRAKVPNGRVSGEPAAELLELTEEELRTELDAVHGSEHDPTSVTPKFEDHGTKANVGQVDGYREGRETRGRERELLAELSETIESASAPGDDGRASGSKSNAREETEFKLRNIVLPEVDFDGVTLASAVDILRERSQELDFFDVDREPSRFSLSIRGGTERGTLTQDGGRQNPGEVRLKGLKLQNVPLETALQSIAKQASLHYFVDESGAVQLSQAAPVGTNGLIAREHLDLQGRTWDIPVAAWKKIQAGQAGGEAKLNAGDFLGAGTDDLLKVPPSDVLKDYGVTFPNGATANYAPSTGTFVVKNTPENLGLIDTLVRSGLEQAKKEQEALKTFEKSAAEEPYSTVSLNVSDVSFKLAKASLDAGQWPAADKIRVEEFVNAFDYGDPAPTQKEKVACKLEQAAHPFLQQRNLLRVSMRTAALGRAAGTPLRLTVLLDNSGSMDRVDRAASVKAAFELLAAQLNPQDQVTLISFARQPRLLADRVAGDKVAQLAQTVEARQSEGGTNLEEALRAGLAKAREQHLEGGQNRIILLTDGAANLGNAKPEDLARLVEEMRGQGIAFDACGVGADGLNDEILESLTRKGDGRYYFLDRPEDADAGFAKQIAGALRPAARNVKVQVQFNPGRVGHYKLYGFEKHLLKKEDFRNDSVDAAEMAGEEAGNAIYQVETLPEGEGEIGTVSVRFQDMASGQMIEKKWTIPYEEQAPMLDQAEPSLKLAAGAALLGEKLKGSMIGEAVQMDRLSKLLHSLPAAFPSDERVKHLVQMAAKVRELAPE